MDLSKHFPLLVESDSAGLRLDAYLSQQFSEVSRSRWSRVIKDGVVLVNEKAMNPSYVLRVHDRLTLTSSPCEENASRSLYSQEVEFTGVEPQVLFEDDDLLVINKPKGLTVHLGAGTKFSDTLVAWLMVTNRLPRSQEALLSFGDQALEQGRPGIVHRLDKPTSGALLICKNPSLIEKIGKQFASKEASRRYWAWVSPKFDSKFTVAQTKIEAMIETGAKMLLKSRDGVWTDFIAFMGRDPTHRTKFAVLNEGKRSHSRFRLIESSKNFSWMDVELLTGRTHQIRVHLSFMGHSIVGDDLYGGYGSDFLRLHAYQLQFTHPRTNERMGVDAPLFDCDKTWAHQQGFSLT